LIYLLLLEVMGWEVKVLKLGWEVEGRRSSY
jgi:hypothetical protein